MPHYSTKLFTGYSTCFRQWRASHSHCQYLHGYALEFKVTFAGDLDERNWVMDFGAFKSNGIKEHLSYMFDHTTLIAADDPQIATFEKMAQDGIIQLRILEHVGCEKFAEYVFNEFNERLSNHRLKVIKVECFENNSNSAIFSI